MHKTSKGYRRFKSRIDYFQEDLETISIFLKNKEMLSDVDKIFVNVNKTSHPRLFKRKSTSGSRFVVIRHLQNTFFVSLIKELYEEVLIYCEYAADCAAQMSPEANRLVGEQNYNFTANELLSKKDRKEITSLIISKVFRGIENKKDTLLLVSALNDRLNLGVRKETIKEAMPYLEARHKFVHADGIVDEKYKSDYPDMIIENGYIKLNNEIVKKAVRAICNLIKEYEDILSANSLFSLEEFQ